MFGPGALLHAIANGANGLGKRMQTQASRADAALVKVQKTQDDAVRRSNKSSAEEAAAVKVAQEAREKLLSKPGALKLDDCRFLIAGKHKAPEPATAPARVPTDPAAALAAKTLARDAAAAAAARDAAANKVQHARQARDKLGPPPPTVPDKLGWTSDNIHEDMKKQLQTSKGRNALAQANTWWDRQGQAALVEWPTAKTAADAAVLARVEQELEAVLLQQLDRLKQRVAEDAAEDAAEDVAEEVWNSVEAMQDDVTADALFHKVVYKLGVLLAVWVAEGKSAEHIFALSRHCLRALAEANKEREEEEQRIREEEDREEREDLFLRGCHEDVAYVCRRTHVWRLYLEQHVENHK